MSGTEGRTTSDTQPRRQIGSVPSHVRARSRTYSKNRPLLPLMSEISTTVPAGIGRRAGIEVGEAALLAADLAFVAQPVAQLQAGRRATGSRSTRRPRAAGPRGPGRGIPCTSTARRCVAGSARSAGRRNWPARCSARGQVLTAMAEPVGLRGRCRTTAPTCSTSIQCFIAASMSRTT